MPTGVFPTLATARLRLRELVATDAPALLAIHGDPAVMRWYGSDRMTRLDQAERLVDAFHALRQRPVSGVRWGLVHAPETGAAPALIGTVGFFRWHHSWRSCLLGYELAAGAQRQGYMREALATVIPWAFARMQVERIEAQVHPDNAPSLRLLARLGFAREGLLREAAQWDGQRHDMVSLGLLQREFVEPSMS